MGKSMRSKIKRKFRAIKREELAPARAAAAERLHQKTIEAAGTATLDMITSAPVAAEGDADLTEFDERRKRSEELRAIKKKNAFKSRKPKGKSNIRAQKTKVGSYFKKKKK